MVHHTRRAVAAEAALREELELLVVGVAGDGARRANAALLSAGMAQIDCLANVAEAVSALREEVGKRLGGLLKETLLVVEQG